MGVGQPTAISQAGGKMGADRVDHRGLLADEQMTRAMEHQAALLLGGLGRDEPAYSPW